MFFFSFRLWMSKAKKIFVYALIFGTNRPITSKINYTIRNDFENKIKSL